MEKSEIEFDRPMSKKGANKTQGQRAANGFKYVFIRMNLNDDRKMTNFIKIKSTPKRSNVRIFSLVKRQI